MRPIKNPARGREEHPDERGAVIKQRDGGTSVYLVYPNTYHVGMSSLGLQTVYGIINSLGDALAERAFLPAEPVRLKPGRTGPGQGGAGLVTVESGSPVREFDIVAFSVSFENDYPNVVAALGMAGLPPYAAGRAEDDPLVILGGVCAFFNPEPLAPFFDLIVVGEAEEVIHELMDAYRANRPKIDKAELLLAFSEIPGIYVPSHYTPAYNQDGTLSSLVPGEGAPERVVRRYVKDIDARPAKSVIVTPDTEFSDMFMVEVSRGCGRQCRFCMAGYIYRPPRHRGLDSVLADIVEGKGRASKIGLVGAAVSDYPDIKGLVDAAEGLGVTFTASSLRADSLTDGLAGLIARGSRSAALAPEAGSARLRSYINKNITEEDILGSIARLISAGILNIKLYFMVGLPTETEEDVEEIIGLAKKAHDAHMEAAKPTGRAGRLTLSINCFVPKPWTPFQWEPMADVATLNRRIRHITKSLRGVPNMNVIHDVPKWAYMQGALARGDRRIAPAIVRMADEGIPPKKAFEAEGLSMEFYAGRTRPDGELFPWDFIDSGVGKAYLLKELKRAHEGKKSAPCNVKKCKACGVCG